MTDIVDIRTVSVMGYRGGRRGSPVEQAFSFIMSAIGSFTHWIIRGFIILILEYFEIDYHPKLPYYIAYIATGVLLAGLGIWGYLWWWPPTWVY